MIRRLAFFGMNLFGNKRTQEGARLLLLFSLATIFVLSLAGGQVTATGLFQSPQSPPSEPPPEPTATPVPPTPVPTEPPPPQPTATPVPAVVEPTPTEEIVASPQESPPAAEEASVEQQVIEPTPTETPPVEGQVVQAEPEPAPLVEGSTEAVGPQPVPITQDQPGEEIVEEAEGGQNLILDQAELIDSIAVSGAYLWLCCGIGFMLLTPLFLLLVYIRGRNRIVAEEIY